MPRPWTKEERKMQRKELERFYVAGKKTITETGRLLGIAEQTVFQRLKFFGIPTNLAFKKRQDVTLPIKYTGDLAEFFGIMLGDGHLSHFQAVINLGTKE